MTHMRRAFALVTLSLLTSAATAHAECAWVLWTKQSLFSRVHPNAIAFHGTIELAAIFVFAGEGFEGGAERDGHPPTVVFVGHDLLLTPLPCG